MAKKYELTKNTRVLEDGKVLHQIRATRDIIQEDEPLYDDRGNLLGGRGGGDTIAS